MKLTKDKNGIYCSEKFMDSTKTVKKFYQDYPFPNYEGKENKSKLKTLTKNNLFVQDLLREIGFGKKIIEIGSGTSQLSNLIASNSNSLVVAFDATYESLLLGKKFAQKNNISNCYFVCADISNINNIFYHNSFDYVICSGVLHHTKNPKENFFKIEKLLKDDGLILIGLYNKFGRLYSKFLKLIYFIFGQNILYLFDPILKNLKISKNQKISWIRDQYRHPIESSHTIDEVINWFKQANINPLELIPNLKECGSEIFKKHFLIHRIVIQFTMIFTQFGKDGGLFIMKGRKIHENNS